MWRLVQFHATFCPGSAERLQRFGQIVVFGDDDRFEERRAAGQAGPGLHVHRGGEIEIAAGQPLRPQIGEQIEHRRVGLDLGANGNVLMSRPTVGPDRSRLGRRPARVPPKITSLSPVYRANSTAQAACNSVVGVNSCSAANAFNPAVICSERTTTCSPPSPSPGFAGEGRWMVVGVSNPESRPRQ